MMETVYNFIDQHRVQIILGVFAAIGILFLATLIILVKISRLSSRSQAFFEGKNGKSLEDMIFKNIQDLKSLDRDIQELYNISNKINALAQKGLHRSGLIRFNPFKDIGGDQSFSLALLDGKNSGFTISSLHTREGTRIYAKPINKGKSEKYTLTEEEKRSVQVASEFKLEKNNL